MKKFTKIREHSGVTMIKEFDETNKAKMDEIKELGWKPLDQKSKSKKKLKKK